MDEIYSNYPSLNITSNSLNEKETTYIIECFLRSELYNDYKKFEIISEYINKRSDINFEISLSFSMSYIKPSSLSEENGYPIMSVSIRSKNILNTTYMYEVVDDKISIRESLYNRYFTYMKNDKNEFSFIYQCNDADIIVDMFDSYNKLTKRQDILQNIADNR